MIPIDEQPYSLPDGWQWCRLGNITEIVGGSTPSSKNKLYYEDGQFPWITPADLSNYQSVYISHGERNITELGLKKSSAKLFPANTVCLTTRALIGYVVLAENQLSTNQGFKNLLPSEKYCPKYLYWYLKRNTEFLKSRASGTIFLELSKIRLEQIPFPLPPLDEQQRIVALLDELFYNLDEAKTLAQAVVDGSEFRRAAIIHKAFTGERTKLWRDEHGTSLHYWKRRTVTSVCKGLIYGTSKKSKSSGKMIVLRTGNLQNGEIDWNDLAYSDDENDIKKYKLTTYDVIFNRTNSAELVGKASIYRGEYPAIYAGYLIKLDYNREVLNVEYLNYVLNSSNAKEYCNHVKTDGVNQSNINARKIGAYVIPLPPLDEQKEIVRLLDDLLGQEQRTKKLAGKILNHIEILKKSILSQAFRGELGTN